VPTTDIVSKIVLVCLDVMEDDEYLEDVASDEAP